MKTAFFDRDGTIIEDYKDEEWTHIQKPVFIEGALNTLHYVQDQKYKIIIITNQYLINERYITYKQYHQLTNLMVDHLHQQGIIITDIFFCPDSRYNLNNKLKPNPYMINQALKKYPEIDVDRSFIVGDSSDDMQLAVNTGIRGFVIGEHGNSPRNNITSLKSISELPRHMDTLF